MKPQEVTPEQIDAWKELHEDVWKITVDGKIAFLRSPDRKTLGFASSVGASDPMKFNEILLKNCWLAGDMEIQTNDKLFLSASSKLAELIEIKETEMVKL
ncbi:MAG: hypothetical protein RLZZ292_1052 [Bacteroidota bacterium]|jgi:hypothetical protein